MIDEDKKVDLYAAKALFEKIIVEMTTLKTNEKDQSSDFTFLGSLLQCLRIQFSEQVPTAGVMYDSKNKAFRLLISPSFFVNSLESDKERIAVLVHELYHLTHKHVFFNTDGIDKRRLNVAMDLAINQLIKNLPKKAMFVENFRDKNKVAFPKNETTEVYYELLDGAEYKKGEGDKGEGGEGEPQEQQWGDASELSDDFDKHLWDSKSEEEKRELMEALKDLMKRSVEKSSHSHSTIPGYAEELLNELDTHLYKIDAKAVLRYAIKTNLPTNDISLTWKRPSRRFGLESKGRVAKQAPSINLYLDTSGSISYNELAEFTAFIDDIFKNVNVKLKLSLFNTEVYCTTVIKKGYKLQESSIRSGGTCLQDTFTHIGKNKADLHILLTDGYYDNVVVPKFNGKVVFVISKNGTKSHPLSRVGPTVQNA